MKRCALLATLCSTVLAVTLQFSACAHISFHDSNDTTRKNVGVEYYKPKLYLLVTRTGDKAYKADIVTLPDLTQPRYALLHPGYGASNLALKLNNGILTDVGQQGDTKVPETLTALASLGTATAGILKDAGVKITDDTPSDEPVRLFEIIQRNGKFILREVQMVKEKP